MLTVVTPDPIFADTKHTCEQQQLQLDATDTSDPAGRQAPVQPGVPPRLTIEFATLSGAGIDRPPVTALRTTTTSLKC
jgi:hypothetical protein